MRLNFAFIGIGSYIAPRHLEAIKSLKHNILISYDSNDKFKISDKYFSKIFHFNDFDIFKKKFKKIKDKINYLVITTPNHLHYKYIKYGLMNNVNVICEKPLVLTNYHLKQIVKLEKKYNKKVYTILQLRTLKVIKNLFDKNKKNKKNNIIKINYLTPRNKEYLKTWKGDIKKSGGILFNIGIHLLDLLCYLFGQPIQSKILKSSDSFSRGEIIFKNAKANYFLSIREKDLKSYKEKKVVRDFYINKKKLDLVPRNSYKCHLDCYKQILFKKNFNLNDVRPSIELALALKKN